MNKIIFATAATSLFLLSACGGEGNSNAVAQGDEVKSSNLGFTLKGDAVRFPDGIEPIEGARITMSTDSPMGKSGGRRQSTTMYVKDGVPADIIETYKKALEAKDMKTEVNEFNKNARVKATNSSHTIYVNASEPRNSESYVQITFEYPDSEFDFPTIAYPAAAE